MTRSKMIDPILLMIFLTACATTSRAQFSIKGQVRTRTERRNGAGTLKPVGNKAALFTSQRTRLTFAYATPRLVLQASLQDVRVWGQDASTISNADGSRLGLHEGWAELFFANGQDSTLASAWADKFSVRIGRQELLYDDSRLLGNLDWLQQARRHDAIVLKWLKGGWQADLGAAFNQNTDAFNYNGTYYTPANLPSYVKDSRGNTVSLPAGLVPLANLQGLSTKTGAPVFMNAPGTNALNQNYKALQFVYAARQVGKTKISALAVTDQFGKYRLDSVRSVAGSDTGFVFGRRYDQAGVHTRYTTGILLQSQPSKAWSVQAGAYYQGGRDKDGSPLSAYTTTVSLSYNRGAFSYIAGWDLLSGNNAFSGSSTSHRFDPLYGTPHKFWGLMDYFYAGTGSPQGGLSDPFVKIRYKSSNARLAIDLDYHYFSLASSQRSVDDTPIRKHLGSELDLVSRYGLGKFADVELGLAWLAATRSMEYAKGLTPNTSELNGSWAYLQVNIRPELFVK